MLVFPKRLIGLFLCLLSLLPWVGQAESQSEWITLVGLDQNHKPVEYQIQKSQYIRYLSGVMTSLHESTFPSLSAQEQKKGSTLRNLAIGFSLGFEAGVGPVLTFEVNPKLQLVYTNQAESSISW